MTDQQDMAGFAPFLLNAVYEMQFDIDDKLSSLKDAGSFNLKTKSHSMRDICTSYLGSLYLNFQPK